MFSLRSSLCRISDSSPSIENASSQSILNAPRIFGIVACLFPMACITSELLFVDGEHIVDFAGNILMTSIIGPRYKLKGMQSVGSGGVGFNLPDAVQLRSEDIELDALVTATHPASGQGRYLAQVQDVSEKALLLKWETSPACSRQRDSRLGIHNPSIFERMIAASQGASWALKQTFRQK